jgi:hypothetical protein
MLNNKLLAKSLMRDFVSKLQSVTFIVTYLSMTELKGTLGDHQKNRGQQIHHPWTWNQHQQQKFRKIISNVLITCNKNNNALLLLYFILPSKLVITHNGVITASLFEQNSNKLGKMYKIQHEWILYKDITFENFKHNLLKCHDSNQQNTN